MRDDIAKIFVSMRCSCNLLYPRRRQEKRRSGEQLLTLLVHLVVLGVRRVRVVAVHLTVTLRIDHAAGATRSVLAGDLVLGCLVADRRQLGSDTAGVARWLTGLRRVSRRTTLDLAGLGLGSSLTLTLFDGLALVLFLLLARLPFLADFLELWNEVSKTRTRGNTNTRVCIGIEIVGCRYCARLELTLPPLLR
jgi:hypothetical protein